MDTTKRHVGVCIRFGIRAMLVIAMASVLALPAGSAWADGEATVDVPTACGVQKLALTRQDGTKISSAEIGSATAVIKGSCDKSAPKALAAARNGNMDMSIVYTNLALFISSTAWNGPYGTKLPLSCGGPVQLTTSGSTGAICFCPRPGTRWEGRVIMTDSKNKSMPATTPASWGSDILQGWTLSSSAVPSWVVSVSRPCRRGGCT
jgi:hypothetical protein